nr:hypothetical protein [Tanacetum cinerariifolium]
MKIEKRKRRGSTEFFLENLKQLHIDFPFIEALAQMPKYAKFLKGLLTNKDRLEEACTITMNERCSAVLLNKLPSKEKDPGSFTIPCDICQIHINNVLPDLGASISLMPYTMYKKLGLGEPKATRMSLELADRLIQYPRGIIENVLIKVNKFVLPIDFVILDMPEDSRVHIILGRPFLATARAMIDVFNKKITLRVLEKCKRAFAWKMSDIKGISPSYCTHKILMEDDYKQEGVTRLKEYSELSAAEAIQADCNVKATNIILQELPSEIYALVSTHKVAKDLWERIQMLMQGTLLMHERHSDPLALISQHQLNMPTYQHHHQSYHQPQLQQQASPYQTSPYTTSYHTPQFVSQGSSSSNLSISYPMNETSSTVNHNAYMASAPQIDYAPSAHHQSEFSSPETGLVVLIFQKGDDPIDAINHMMSFLTSVVTSRYPTTNNQLRTSSNPRQQATINDGRVAIQPIQGRQNQMSAGSSRPFTSGSGEISGRQRSTILAQSNTESTSDSNIISYSKYMNESQYNTVQNSTLPASQDDLILSVIEQLKTQVVNCTKINHDNKQVNELLTAELERGTKLETVIPKNTTKQIRQTTQAQQLKPKLYDGCVIEKSEAIVVPDTKETLLLAEESRSKMIEKQNDPQMTEKKVVTKPINYDILNKLSTDFEKRFVTQTESSAEQAFWSQYLVQTDEPNLSGTTTVEVPKKLPKVSMVNSCLKKLKSHLANFDMVVKERTTATAITEGTWGFEHTKAYFRDDIIPFVKSLKELFTSFDQCLIDEVTEAQNVFMQMELDVEQNCEEKSKVQAKMENV